MLGRFLAIAVALLVVDPRPAGAVTVDWSSFDDVLPDTGFPQNNCDIVHVDIQHNAVNAAMIELDLDVGIDVVWWKGVGIGLQNGKYYEISTPGQVRHDSIQLPAIDVMSAKYIELGKAKFLGIHTGMYELYDTKALQPGDRVSFHWVQDECIWLDGDIQTLPDWLPPGQTTTITIAVRNRGHDWHPDAMLSIHVDGLATEYRPVTTEVPHWDKVLFNVTFTTPATSGDYPLTVKVFQGSGRSAWILPAYHEVHVSVNPPKPPPPPPPPPPPVHVPLVVGMSLADAEKQLASVGLTDHVLNNDSSVPPDQLTVYVQSPMAGSSVAPGTSVELDVMQPGYSALWISNCGRSTMYLWELVSDHWEQRAEIASNVNDNGTCVFSPVEYALTDGAFQYFAIVDPSAYTCSTGNDPYNSGCRPWEALTLGSSKGLPEPVTVE